LADGKTREYGDPNGTLTGTVSGLKNGDSLGAVTTGTLSFTTAADNFSDVGSYAITGAGLAVASTNYQGAISQAAFNTTALTVAKAQLYYTANPITRTYGDPNPVFGGLITGLKNGQSFDAVASGPYAFTSATDQTSNAGSYAVNGSGLTVFNSNYMPAVIQNPLNATALTISPATLFYRAFDATRIYGSPDPSFDGAVIGFVNGDTLDSVTDGT